MDLFLFIYQYILMICFLFVACEYHFFLPVSIYFHISIFFIYSSTCFFICLLLRSTYLSVHLSIYLLIYSSISLFILLSLLLPFSFFFLLL